MNELSPLEVTMIAYLAISISCVSIIASIHILMTMILKNKNHFINPLKYSTMSFNLTICDLILAVITIVTHATNKIYSNKVITLIAIISQFYSFSGFLWTGMISYNSMESVLKVFAYENSRGLRYAINQNKEAYHMIAFNSICWGLPLFTSAVMLATHSCGYHLYSYWVIIDTVDSTSRLNIVAAVIVYWLPLLFVQSYNIYVFRFLASMIRRIPSSQDLMQTFTKYLSILIGMKLLFIVYRGILLFLPQDKMTFSTTMFCAIIPPLQGIGDYLILSRQKKSTNPSLSDSTHSSHSESGRNMNSSRHSIDPLMTGAEDDGDFNIFNPMSYKKLRSNSISSPSGHGGDDTVEIDFNEDYTTISQVAEFPV